MSNQSRQLADRTSRYLARFGEIEAHLRKLLHVGPETDFRSMIDLCRRRALFGRGECDALDRFRRVRNALSHDGVGTHVKPTPEAVGEIDRFLTRLNQAPPVGELFRREVMAFQSADPLLAVVQAMRQRDYSQVPVYEGSEFQGLLTAVTIARWLGHELEHEGGVMDDTRVADALVHAEGQDNVRFIGRDVPSLEVPSVFQDSITRGMPVEALLITQSGKPAESLLGIVTPADLPSILRAH
jgi:predicted transcriptional regulator